MFENAYQFVAISIIFPFLLVFLLAGIAALIGFGTVLLVKGLKIRWPESNNAKRAAKIIMIVVGILLLLVALLIISYTTCGFVMVVQRGGILGNRNSANQKPEENLIICFCRHFGIKA